MRGSSAAGTAVSVRSIFDRKKQVNLVAVMNDGIPENQRYHKYTPNGSIEMTIDNPPASEQFEPGKQFYVDFTQAE
jgi:hypothetical protein